MGHPDNIIQEAAAEFRADMEQRKQVYAGGLLIEEASLELGILVEYTYSPSEKRTYDNPGERPSIEIRSVKSRGFDLTLPAGLVKLLEREILEGA